MNFMQNRCYNRSTGVGLAPCLILYIKTDGKTSMISLTLLLALILDRVLGEAKRWHPLMGFGILAAFVEKHLHPGADSPHWQQFLSGLIALLILLAPFVSIAFVLQLNTSLSSITAVLILYLAIGAQSLKQHARAVSEALQNNDPDDARLKTGYLVSRDTANMSTTDMSRATIESVLENGNDAIFAALFWFLVAGIPGVVIYRLVNTLDAMWGYRTPRFQYFGKAAARLDDILNLIPARLTALGYALVGHFSLGIRCWVKQGHLWESPNAGPVMAAGAGALAIQLGGDAEYHGEIRQRCFLGEGHVAHREDIGRAIQLVNRSLLLWLLVITGVETLA